MIPLLHSLSWLRLQVCITILRQEVFFPKGKNLFYKDCSIEFQTFNFCFVFVVLVIELMALHMLGKCCITELVTCPPHHQFIPL